MEQIVLDTNLRFITATLSLEQKGLLFDALLGQEGVILSEAANNIYQYISLLQEKADKKRQKMREIGAKGNETRKRLAKAGENKTGDLFSNSKGKEEEAVSDMADDKGCADERAHCVRVADALLIDKEEERKEAKESILNKNIKKLFTRETLEEEKGDCISEPEVFSKGDFDRGQALVAEGKSHDEATGAHEPLSAGCLKEILADKIEGGKKDKRRKKEVVSGSGSVFVPMVPEIVFKAPSVAEVREFVANENLDVDAETFVDFYESHGWCVGRTAIKNWRATARLWHRRAGDFGHTACKNKKGKLAEEAYWHELSERTAGCFSKPEAALFSGGEAEGKDKLPNFEGVKARYPELSPFTRFMKRIEDNDFNPER